MDEKSNALQAAIPGNVLVSIIDDDESVRGALKSFMLSVGFRAEIFPSAEDFLVSYTRGKTTCMIVDGHMPVTKSPRLKNSFVGTRTMEYAKMNGLNPDASRIGLGTWSIGGFMWGGNR